MVRQNKYKQSIDLKIYQISEEIADEIYSIVIKWKFIDKRTVGIQLIKSTDSIGANIAESQGRHHLKDSINFLYFSRGSIEETKFWLARAVNRKLISTKIYEELMKKIDNLAPQVNSFITAKRKNANHQTI